VEFKDVWIPHLGSFHQLEHVTRIPVAKEGSSDACPSRPGFVDLRFEIGSTTGFTDALESAGFINPTLAFHPEIVGNSVPSLPPDLVHMILDYIFGDWRDFKSPSTITIRQAF
jgi:hypothetical protein